MADYIKHNARVYQLDFIVIFLQEKANNRVFVKLDSRYANNFREDSIYFGRAFRLLKSVYWMTNSVKLFDYAFKPWFIESVFKKKKIQMSIYY